MKNLYFFFLLLLVSGCNNNKHVEQDIKPINYNSENKPLIAGPYYLSPEKVEELKSRIIETGDSDAFDALVTFYLDSAEVLYPYSKIMSEQYNRAEGSFMAYIYWIHLYETANATKGDKEALNEAIRYLRKAVRQGGFQARINLGMYYREGKYVKQDTVLGKYLMSDKVNLDSLQRIIN